MMTSVWYLEISSCLLMVYTLSVLLVLPVSSMASSSIASSIRSNWFTPLGNGINVLDVYDQLCAGIIHSIIL